MAGVTPTKQQISAIRLLASDSLQAMGLDRKELINLRFMVICPQDWHDLIREIVDQEAAELM